MRRVHGVDGAPGGWVAVSINLIGALAPIVSFLPEAAPLLETGDTVAIDIPIGFPERILGPGRRPEQTIRPLLGARRASVFSMPARAVLDADDYKTACAVARATSDPPRAISIQAFNILPKVRELDRWLTPANQHTVFEVHAELAFWQLNDRSPMPTGKAVRGVPARDALASRIALLEVHGLAASTFAELPPRVPLVDAVDAAALAVIARRCAAGTAVPYPAPPDIDARGLRIAIWA